MSRTVSAQEVNNDFNTIFNVVIVTGQANRAEGTVVSVCYFPRNIKNTDVATLSLTLSGGLPVPPFVQEIAWGLVRVSDSEIITTGRTDRQGQFLATAPAGEYRVKYVLNITSELDRQILLKIGDEAARAELRREAVQN